MDHCSASATNLWFVIKCCSSCFKFLNLFYPLSYILISTAASPYYHSKCFWMQVSFSPSSTKNSTTAHCFNCISISAILESNVVLPSVRKNRCKYDRMFKDFTDIVVTPINKNLRRLKIRGITFCLPLVIIYCVYGQFFMTRRNKSYYQENDA